MNEIERIVKFNQEFAGTFFDYYTKEEKEAYDKDIKKAEFALRLTKEVEEQLLKDKAFMWGKDEKLEGYYSTLTRRGILQLLVDKANNE